MDDVYAQADAAFLSRLPKPYEELSNPAPVPSAQNTVTSATLGPRGLDPLLFAAQVAQIDHNPLQFGPIVFRNTGSVPTTQLLFPTGSAVTTGARGLWCARCGAQQLRTTLSSLGYATRARNFGVQNIVSCVSVGHGVDTARFCPDPRLGVRVSYDPQNFPGLFFRARTPGGVEFTMLIFDSGMVVITGIKEIGQGQRVFRKLLPYFRKYKCDIAPKSQQRQTDRIVSKLRNDARRREKQAIKFGVVGDHSDDENGSDTETRDTQRASETNQFGDVGAEVAHTREEMRMLALIKGNTMPAPRNADRVAHTGTQPGTANDKGNSARGCGVVGGSGAGAGTGSGSSSAQTEPALTRKGGGNGGQKRAAADTDGISSRKRRKGRKRRGPHLEALVKPLSFVAL